MKIRYLALLAVSIGLLSLFAALNVARAAALTGVQLSLFASAESATPTEITHAGDARTFISYQSGRIYVVDAGGNTLPTPFLDINSKVPPAWSLTEQGLLGLAFHPNYATNGYFYVNYINLTGDTIIARYSVDSTNPNLADASSEFIVMTIAQPQSNHNSGSVRFGPDGYLYLTLGDGAGSGDPFDVAQDPASLLGKILRIDVDGGSPYAIPASNPFVGNAGVLDEIWAFGIRNSWRLDFDQLTGDMWFADPGQLTYEEVNFEPAGSTGGRNYGWDCREGLLAYAGPGMPSALCATATGLTDPIHVYDHTSGRCAIMGGTVYRGTQNPDMVGAYFFADYCSGEIFALTGGGASPTVTSLTVTGGSSLPVTFGRNAANELFLGYGTGEVHKIDQDDALAINLSSLNTQAASAISLLTVSLLLSVFTVFYVTRSRLTGGRQ